MFYIYRKDKTMKKITLFITVFLLVFSYKIYSQGLISNENKLTSAVLKPEVSNSQVLIDNQIIEGFFKKYANLQEYQSKVSTLYINRNFKSIWFDADCKLVDLATQLYAKTNSLNDEAVTASLAYQDVIEGIINTNANKLQLSYNESEMLLSCLYVYYVQNVYNDFDTIQLQKMAWFLQGKELDYNTFLDDLLENPKLLDFTEKYQFSQYYKLRSALKKYVEIAKKGEWNTIEYDSTLQHYKPYDSCSTISQIRHRLYILGDLETDSQSGLYDHELMNAVLRYKKRYGYYANYFITPLQIKQLNLPIEDYIQKIKVNMERCRWVDPELDKADEYIMVNIPAFKMNYVRNGQRVVESNVVVGQDMMQTVIFSGCVKTIVFSPYWYVPQSIIENELKSPMSKDKNYLESRDMEWNGGKIRQRPGPKNSMGLVKFLFPNSNDIYLHDTPSKTLFGLDYRAFSHGCINLQKSRELAHAILKDNPDWPADCIDWAMNRKEESFCELQKEIPIHLAYFTAWVDEYDVLHFYDDLYERDAQLAQLKFPKENLLVKN